MDNRRVMKAYRDRSGQYQTSGGLFSRVKRYFSGTAAPDPQIRTVSAVTAPKRSATAHEPTPLHSNTLLADLSRSILSTSVLPAADSEDSNRILSSFFQEKGGKPLTDVEYEGVMALLERSKASITLPLPDQSPKKPETMEASNTVNTNNQNSNNQNANNSINTQSNHTFGPYSQTKLRNSSMYLNNSSFAVSDYKPQYHTFNESTSRANMSMKRVYQFSGLPSPYRTRIKAPDLAARKLRRITPVVSHPDTMDANLTTDKTVNASSNTAAGNVADRTANHTIGAAQQSFRPKSKTANALLSVLDGKKERNGPELDIQLEVREEEIRRPLHNPYFRPKRRQITRHPVASLTAADISNTILHNKTEEIKAPMDSKGASLFENIDGKELEKTKITELVEKEKADVEKDSIQESEVAPKTFNFGTKATNLTDKPSFTSSTSALEEKKDVPKSTFTFKPTEKSNESGSKSPEKVTGFTFTAAKSVEQPTEQQPKKPISFGFGNGSAAEKKDSDAFSEVAKPGETQKKPIFGANKSESSVSSSTTSTSTASASASASTSTFSFGNQTLKPFNFGQKSETKKVEPGSGFSSGAAAKPQFLFGEVKKPESVSFGAETALASQNSQTGDQSAAQNTAPKFTFGNLSNGTGFGLGVDNVARADESTTSSTSKAPFSFCGARANESTTPSTSKAPFSFGGVNGVGGNVSGSNGGEKHDLPEFTFPDIPRIEGKFDANTVKSYESIFKF